MYSESIQASEAEFFSENSRQLLAADCFCEKSPSRMFDWVLNVPLGYILNCFLDFKNNL